MHPTELNPVSVPRRHSPENPNRLLITSIGWVTQDTPDILLAHAKREAEWKDPPVPSISTVPLSIEVDRINSVLAIEGQRVTLSRSFDIQKSFYTLGRLSPFDKTISKELTVAFS